MNEFLLIVGMAVATMATRIPVLLWLSKRKLPESLFRALRYVPPAVLTAIILPAVMLRDGELALGWNNATLLASMVAVLVSWRTRSLLFTVFAGMAAFFIWRLLLNS